MNGSLNDLIRAAEQQKEAAENTLVEMTYGEMTRMFRAVEDTHGGHVEGAIVFAQQSFTEPYSEESRTYLLSSNNKAFQSGMGGYSIYGSCKDGTDPCVRLERYMSVEKGGKDGWMIERCYMKQSEVDKAKSIIEHNKDKQR